MTFRHLCCLGVLVSAALVSPSARALEADVVDSKFASVTVLAPVTEAGELRPITDVGMVAFFSPLAANLFAQGWRKKEGTQCVLDMFEAMRSHMSSAAKANL